METLAWPERVVSFLFAFEVIWILTIGLVGNPHALSDGWIVALLQMWRIPFFTLGPLWAFLRLLDLAMGGPARRKGVLIVLPPQQSSGLHYGLSSGHHARAPQGHSGLALWVASLLLGERIPRG